MRTRQDGKRQQPLWVLIRDLPRETGTPVVTNKVEPPIAMSDSGDNIKRVANQSINSVAGVVGRVRSCAGRIAALVGGRGEIPGFPERLDLGVRRVWQCYRSRCTDINCLPANRPFLQVWPHFFNNRPTARSSDWPQRASGNRRGEGD